VQVNYKNKLNLTLINSLLNINSQGLVFKYKIFLNKNFIFYIISNIIILFFSWNLLNNNSINVNLYFNLNFLYFF